MPYGSPPGLRTFPTDNVAGNRTAGQEAFGARSVYLGVSAGEFSGLFPGVAADDNVIIGDHAAQSNRADGVVSIGAQSLGGLTLPNETVALGFQAGPLDSSQVSALAAGNVYIGARAARNTDNAANAGGSNLVIGFEAAEFQGGGFFRNCVIIGRRAARGTLATVTQNSQQSVIIGTEAGEACEQGCNNSVAIGYRAGHGSGANPTVSGSVLIGDRAGEDIITGSSNVAIGSSALTNGTFATGNVAIGAQAMQNASSASQNICIGVNAGQALSTQTLNVLIGDDLLGGAANENIMISPDGVGPAQSNCVVFGYRVQAGGFAQGTFAVESVNSAGVNRRPFLFGDMRSGNLIIGSSTIVSGVANNRDTGGGGNTVKMLDVNIPFYFGTTGPPTANPVGGSFQYFDSAAGVGAVGAHQFRLPSGVIVTLGDVPSVTGSRAANAALASLLTILAASGIITDNTVV